MDSKEARVLLRRYRKDKCTDEERQLVEKWYMQLLQTGQWEWQEEEKQLLEQAMEINLIDRINSQNNNQAHRIPIWNSTRWWAAASILLILSTGFYFLFYNKIEKPNNIAKVITPRDVKAPEINKAVITLANGQTVYLDSAVNGQLALQGNVKLVKLANGQIVYENSAIETSKEVSYNTLSNPRGSKVISVKLSDGTQVWLNAGSSISYPVVFVENERKVSVSGEAYFEVAHNPSNPFVVSKGTTEIRVLGTHFNVNAYDDEDAIRVTLLEGSVKVETNNKTIRSEAVIKPDEQAIAKVDGQLIIAKNVNLEEIMAWKNGKFLFNGTDIQTTMREIARWYDVDIDYQAEVKGFFKGSIERKENISEVLKMMAMTEEVSFEIKGRTIVVKP